MQRRHQKVVEEAPAPGSPGALREALLEAAVAFGRAIGYRSAGHGRVRRRRRRVLLPRAERPHPGRAPGNGGRHGSRPGRRAAPRRGRAKPGCSRSEPQGRGARRSRSASMPRIRVRSSRRPGRSRDSCCQMTQGHRPGGVRVDAGVEEGDEIGLSYDPMIAKVVAHGRNRDEALDLLAAALAEDRGGGRDDEPPVPSLARLSSGGPRRRGDDRVPDRESPTQPTPTRRPPEPWNRPWRLNLPAPAPAAPPDVEARRSRRHGHASGETHGRRADAGNGDTRRSRGREKRCRLGSRSSCWRR